MRAIRSWQTMAVVGALAGLNGSCGGDSPSPRTADDVPETDVRERPAENAMSASSEIGALDPEKVTAAFENAMGGLEQCLHDGAERIEFLGGEIAFFLKVGSDGRLVHAQAERSTLGDRQTERCMIRVLEKQTWPPPQGGDVGLARNSFDFDMPNDVRPPVDWDSERVSEVIAELSNELSSCRSGVGGEFMVTIYVDAEGKALGVGAAASDEAGDEAADCIAKALAGATYPSPGSWPAKVTFTL